MTTAVCLRCGSSKRGAWTPCSRCGHDPVGCGLEEEARALALSSRFASMERLSAASDAIARGDPPPVDQALVERFVRDARIAGQTSLVQPTPRWLVALPRVLLVTLAVLTAVVLAWAAVGAR